MYKHINEELIKSQQDKYRLQKIESMIKTLENELHACEDKAQLAYTNLDKENKDYEKLTHKNISSIILTVLGKLEEKTEKERQEALDAQLKYNQCTWELEDIRKQISALEAEKRQYKNANEEYNRLYNQKLQLLISENNQTAQQIVELKKRIEQSKCNIREIEEALYVGYDVQRSLSTALDSLDSAESWGTWDLFGGGLVTDMIKHSHIDEANSAVQQTQSLLRRFRTELADVQISAKINIDISDFAKFADFFFDGLFADWFMQSKINDSQNSVRNVQSQVQNVMHKLRELKTAEQRAQESLEIQISQLVVDK